MTHSSFPSKDLSPIPTLPFNSFPPLFYLILFIFPPSLFLLHQTTFRLSILPIIHLQLLPTFFPQIHPLTHLLMIRYSPCSFLRPSELSTSSITFNSILSISKCLKIFLTFFPRLPTRFANVPSPLYRLSFIHSSVFFCFIFTLPYYSASLPLSLLVYRSFYLLCRPTSAHCPTIQTALYMLTVLATFVSCSPNIFSILFLFH